MDRIDAQTATGAIEHRGEQRARARNRCFVTGRTNGDEIGGQFLRLHPHPIGQHFIDARRHFSRASFGECKAQYLLRTDTFSQQQPQHAGGKHLRLASTGRGGQPHAVIGRDCKRLIVLQLEDLAAHRLAPFAALPFFKAHQLIVCGIARRIGVEPGGERLFAQYPFAQRIVQEVFGFRQEILWRNATSLGCLPAAAW